MNKKDYSFIENKLNELSSKEIITEEQCVSALSYFEKQIKSDKSMITIFTGIGLLLVALGVITLFAINWSLIPKIIKIMISFMPIIITAIMLFFTMKNDSNKMKIYTSIIAPLSILATNSLIVQVFNIQMEIYQMFFMSVIMFMPITFILKNYLSIFVYSIGAIIYISCSSYNSYMCIWAASVVLLPLIIYGIINYKKDKSDKRNTLIWLAIFIGMTVFATKLEILREYVLPFYFYLIYLISKTLFEEKSILTKIFKVSTMVFLLIACAFENFHLFNKFTFGIDMGILILLIGVFIFLSKSYKKPKEYFDFIFVCLLQTEPLLKESFFIFSNLLALLLGCYKIVLGTRYEKYKEAMQGIAIILYLIFIRFVNSDLSFTIKSIIFLVSGVSFIVIANILKKKLGGGKDEQK